MRSRMPSARPEHAKSARARLRIGVAIALPPKAARTSRRLRKAAKPDRNPSGPVAFRVCGDLESSGRGTFGAGTIISDRYGLAPRLSSKSRAGPPSPRETERHRESPTSGDLSPSSSAAALRRYRYRSPGDRVPPWCSYVRPSLTTAAFGTLTVGSDSPICDSSALKHVPTTARRFASSSRSCDTARLLKLMRQRSVQREHDAVHLRVLKACAQASSVFSSWRMILPVLVFGTSSTNCTWRGTL